MPAWETRGGVLGPQGWVFPCVGLCWVWNSSGSLTLPPLSLLGAGSPSAFPSGKFCPALSLQQHNHGGRGLSLSSPVSPPPPHNPAPRGEPAPPPPRPAPLVPAQPVDAPTCCLQGLPDAPTWGVSASPSTSGLTLDAKPRALPPRTPLHLEGCGPALWVRARLRACPCVGTHVAPRGNSGCGLLCCDDCRGQVGAGRGPGQPQGWPCPVTHPRWECEWGPPLPLLSVPVQPPVPPVPGA